MAETRIHRVRWFIALVGVAVAAVATPPEARGAEAPAEPVLQVVLRNQLGGSYVPVRAEAMLDGKQVFEHVASPGRPVPFGEVFRGTTTRGIHALQLYLVFEGRSPLFGYVSLYRFHMRARATMEMKPGRDLEVTLTSFERGPLTSWENRPDFRVTGTPKEALLDVETLPIEKGQIKESGASASKAPPEGAPRAAAAKPLDEAKLAQIEEEAVQEVLKEAERRRVEKEAVAQAEPEKTPPDAVPIEPVPDFTKPTKPGRPPRSKPPPRPGAAEPKSSPEAEPEPTSGAAASEGECRFPEVHFGVAQFSLGPKAKRGLSAWAECAGKAAEHIRVVGHCDVRGSATYNQTLGQWRADAVARFLTKRGIPASRIEASSQGEDAPRCAENTEACHAQNRRVELER